MHIVADSANQPSEQAKQNYLFIKFVLKPALQSVLLEQIQQFRKPRFPEEEDEILAIKVDAALIQKRFPSSLLFSCEYEAQKPTSADSRAYWSTRALFLSVKLKPSAITKTGHEILTLL